MSGKMATAKKLPSGNWRVLVYSGKDQNGKRKYESFTAPTKREVEFIAAEWLAKHSGEKKPENMTLYQAYERYIESKKNVLSPATVREYTRQKNHDFPDLMRLPIKDITNEKVQIAVNIASKNQSPKTVRNSHGLLSAVLSVYRPDIQLKTSLPAKRKANLYIPNNEDIAKIIKAIKGTEMELPVLLAAFGSLRRSEIAALEYSDFSGNFVTITKALVQDKNKKWIVKQPKTEAGNRTIELPEEIIKLIPKNKSGRVVSLHPNNYVKNFQKILLEIGVPKFRFHDLRHYQASILLAMGIPDKYIMERGGWKSLSTLKNIYQHTMEKKSNEVSSKINSYFSSLIKDK